MAYFSWRTRRKIQYLTSVFVFVAVIFSVPIYNFLKKAPTCFDGTHNGDELGVDCGGSCILVCSADVRPVSVVWERAFTVTRGVVTAAAYAENPNFGLVAPEVPYRFQVFDAQNVLIAEKRGTTYIATDGAFVLFEGPLSGGERVPDHVAFTFDTLVPWYRRSEAPPLLEVKRQELVATTTPRIEADIYNAAVTPLSNIEVIAVAYDRLDNALGVSRTFIDTLAALDMHTVTFSWPHAFSDDVARILVLPRTAPSVEQ